MRIILTRHGQTDDNLRNIIHKEDRFDLNNTGVIQTEKLTKRLSNYKIATIISSPIKRCTDTIDIINATLKTSLIYEDLIKERNSGDFVNINKSKLPWDSLKGDFINKRPPGGESLFMVRKRVREFRKKNRNRLL